MKLKLSLILFVVLFDCSIKAQNKEQVYENTYKSIDSMLIGLKPLNFQQAVFITENVYFDNKLDKTSFDEAIKFNTSICRRIIAAGDIE